MQNKCSIDNTIFNYRLINPMLPKHAIAPSFQAAGADRSRTKAPMTFLRNVGKSLEFGV